MNTISIYIHFPKNIDTLFDKQEKAFSYLKDFQILIDLADCEKDTELFYCKLDKDNFIDDIQLLEELLGNIGVYDFETVINYLFWENGIKEITEDNKKDDNIYSVYSNTELGKNIPYIFKEAAKKASIHQSYPTLIINAFNLYSTLNPIHIIVEAKNSQNPKISLIKIPLVTNFIELDKWLQENRAIRNFNNDDTRHIEHSGNHRKDKNTKEYKSPLLGGFGGRTNAKELLKTAIGDKRINKDLMNYDKVHGAYIWYEYENDNPQNQYHAYHLVKAFSHQIDYDAIEKIPLRVKKILKYRTENVIP